MKHEAWFEQIADDAEGNKPIGTHSRFSSKQITPVLWKGFLLGGAAETGGRPWLAVNGSRCTAVAAGAACCCWSASCAASRCVRDCAHGGLMAVTCCRGAQPLDTRGDGGLRCGEP